MGWRDKKDEKDSKELNDEKIVEPTPPRASIFQLFRYTTIFDRFLLLLGLCVAIATGVGMPLMSIVLGNISQNFIDIGTQMSFPNFTDPAVKKIVYASFSDAVIKNCLSYTYIGVGVFAAATIQTICLMTVCENLVHRLRRNFFLAILRQDIEWFDRNHSGTVATKLFDNLERVKEGTGDKLGLLVQAIAQFVGGFVIAFTYDWKLTLIMMSLAPFLIACGATLGKLVSRHSAVESELYSSAGGIAEEALTAMRTVIAFNGQKYECKRYDAALEAGKNTGIVKILYIGIALGLTFFIAFSSNALAFWVGTDFVADGKMDGGTVMTVFFSVMMGSMALGSAGPQLAVLATALGAAGSLYEIIDRLPLIDAYSKDGIRPSEMKGKISIKNLRFSYPSRPDVQVLMGLNLEANPGETIALVGSSGCGKSTVVQLLLRYYNPESGTISIDGHEIRDINIEFLRNYIGVVSQEPTLFNTTIEENIRYGRDDVTSEELMTALKRANAYHFVKEFPDGIQTLVGDRGTQLSGGQKQRIAIARALVRNPKILLLDEATSALDAESEGVVQAALENASKGRTTIVIAHRLSTIRNADKIIAMKAGEMVETGTHDELLGKKGLYYELVNAQVFVDVEPNCESNDRKMSVASSIRSIPNSVGDGIKRLQSHMSQISTKEDQKTENGKKKEAEDDLTRLKKELEAEGGKQVSLFRILSKARQEWPIMAVGTIFSVIKGCIFPAFSLTFAQVVKVFAEPDPDKMRHDGHLWALVFLGIAALEGIGFCGEIFFYGMSAERFTGRLRSSVFRNIMRMDAAYFDETKHSPGKITTRLATDAPNVKMAISYNLGGVVGAIVTIITGLGVSFYFGWQMALLVLAIFPIAIIGESLEQQYHARTASRDANSLESSGKVAMEAIESIRTVQALTLQNRLFDQFQDHLEGPHSSSRTKAVIHGFTYGFASSIFYFLYASSFRFGLWLIINGHMDYMNVLRVLYTLSFAAGGVGQAASYFPEYLKATFAAGLIFKMLDEEPGIDGMTSNGKKPALTGEVNLRNVYFKYPERPNIPILQGLDLKVAPGETLALVGPSGCGKSTVISLLERLYDPLDGQVTIDGNDLREVNPTHLRAHIAIVSQEPILFDTSIRNNIVYGLDEGSVSDQQIQAAAVKANIHKFVSELPEAYETRVGDKGTQLSGGQKQRIAIARALVRNPKILLLDEATSALDTESEKLVQEALDVASKGRTCIVVAHRLSTVVNANCIMVVNGGKVVEKGTHLQLMAMRGAYWSLTQKQNHHLGTEMLKL